MRKQFLFTFIFFSFISFQISAQTWSSINRLTWNAGSSSGPSLAADSGTGIHVVWYDQTPGNHEIFYKHSTDGGTTWSGFKRLTWNASASEYPTIASDSSSGIHVVWDDKTLGDDEIYYKRSTDSGATWLAKQRLTWNSGWSEAPSIALDSSSGIHVVWYDDTPGNAEIFYRRSTNSGATWLANQRLTWNTGNTWSPSIATDSSTGIHAAWYDDTPGNYEIFYKRSSDGGATWSGLKRLTWNAGDSEYPSIATDSGTGIYIVWWDDTPGNREIFYRRSTDGGATWLANKRLTWNAGNSWSPSIVVDSGNGIHVAWKDLTPGNLEIFHKSSSDGGATWSALTRLTWNSGSSADPSIEADSGIGIHVVWNDNTPGNWEIYYKNRK